MNLVQVAALGFVVFMAAANLSSDGHALAGVGLTLGAAVLLLGAAALALADRVRR